MAKDYYQLLGVSRAAPEREIKRSYHDLARKLHPDKAPDPEEAKRLEEEFAAITKAYNTLKDVEKRREYDGKLAKEDEAAQAAVVAGTPVPSAPSSETSQASATAAGSKKAVSPPMDRRMEAGRQAIAERSFSKGVQLSNMGDFTRAIEFLETAIKNSPEEPRYLSALAGALMKARKGFTRAEEVAVRACELDPYNIEYKLILGNVYEQAGVISKARTTYENVLKWDAENAEAAMRLTSLNPKKSQSFFLSLADKFKKKIGL
ncbi:MAG: DnaJ domain-containing protein [Candidatus Sumerlaeota bacterium]|nr:DnaJ domain-containing protein [Candidatus Sumerlaeota bacterium]